MELAVVSGMDSDCDGLIDTTGARQRLRHRRNSPHLGSLSRRWTWPVYRHRSRDLGGMLNVTGYGQCLCHRAQGGQLPSLG